MDGQHIMRVPLFALVSPKGLALERMQVDLSVRVKGTEAQQAELLPKVAEGALKLAFAHDFVGTLKFSRAAGTGKRAEVDVGGDVDLQAAIPDLGPCVGTSKKTALPPSFHSPTNPK